LILANDADTAHVIKADYSIRDAYSENPLYECYVQATDKCSGFGDFDLIVERGQYIGLFACCSSCMQWIETT